MGSTYWVKLYHEVLSDPKMGRLTDRLWRRVIECFLLAGEQGEGGWLPPLEDMAWVLRCEPGRLEGELSQIAEKTGIVEKRTTDAPDGTDQVRWFVVKFEARQAAAAPAERKVRQRVRDRQGRYECHHVVTNRDSSGHDVVTNRDNSGHDVVTNRDTDIDIDTEREKEKEKEKELNPPGPPQAGGNGRAARAKIAPPSGSGPPVAEDVLAYHHRLSGIGLNTAQASLLVAGVEALGAEKVRKAIKDWLERGYKPWNVEGMLQVARNGWDRASPKGEQSKAAARGDPAYFKANMPEWVKH